jgi:hypothetical protein
MRSLFFISALCLVSTNAFSLLSKSESPVVDRRAFVVSTAALLIATPAVAIDDLAMPTEEENRLSEEVCLILWSCFDPRQLDSFSQETFQFVSLWFLSSAFLLGPGV